MIYIVMDLEWNQCSGGKNNAVSGIPFEIIEIGAVKLNENRQILSYFQQIIRPNLYPKLHFAARKLLHISEEDLSHGKPFPEAIFQFLNWCKEEREEYRFCTWGSMDLMELQRNCHYYGMDHCFSKPLFYYDLQKCFSLQCAIGRNYISLEYAVDYFELDKKREFHHAITDAEYTAEIFKKLSLKQVKQYYSVDYYQIPDSKKQEIYMEFPTYTKHVSKKYETKEKALKDRAIRMVCCPLCKRRATRRIRWYTSNLKNYYSLSECKEHGYLRGKLKVRKTDDGFTYIIKTVHLIKQKEAEEMRLCRKELKKKKKKRKLNK